MDPQGDAVASRTSDAPYDVERVRRDFPILDQEVHGRPLAYLDNAATSQKPRPVVEAIAAFYDRDNSNVHRGVHALSQRATDAYEAGREAVRRLVGAERSEQVVWVRGTTEAINLVAQAFVRPRLETGDEILITEMEHHSNIVPWQLVCQATGAKLEVAPIDDDGQLLLDAFADRLGPRTKFVAFTHVSNALGTINPVRALTEMAHDHGAHVLVDGAQAVPHMPVDVQRLGCDFYALSGHKMYGPTGIGALVGRHDLLEAMPPYQGGGEMITKVTFERSEYKEPPYRFEAGTPDIAGAVGLGAAVEYLEALGLDRIRDHEQALTRYGTERLAGVEGLRLIGTAKEKAGVLSFVVEGVHAHDVGTILDREGVAVRTGHHCAQPTMERFGVPATARASIGLYNTEKELDRLVEALGTVREVFG